MTATPEPEAPAVQVPVRSDVGNWASSIDRLAVDAGLDSERARGRSG